MQCSIATTKDDLLRNTELWLEFLDGTITSDATLKARFTEFLNQLYLDAVEDILAAEGS